VNRRLMDRSFYWFCKSMTWMALGILLILIFHICRQGCEYLDWQFLSSLPSRSPEKAGIKTALAGTVWIICFTALFAIPFGIATALYLEEYAPKRHPFVRLLQINIANLAGMPSIIYGLLGLTIFVRSLGFERSILAGSLTLALLILPVIVIASQEAIKAVPDSIRFAAYAMGARRYQVVLGQVLPSAIPGIMTGIILSISRAIGETAPLIIVGAMSYIAYTPESIFDMFTVLPVQIYNWAGRPKEEFHAIAAAGIMVLLLLLLSLNFIAVTIRSRYQRYK